MRPEQRQRYIDSAKTNISDAERMISGPTHPTNEHLKDVLDSIRAAEKDLVAALSGGEVFVPPPYETTQQQVDQSLSREERAAARVAEGQRMVLSALDILLDEPDPEPAQNEQPAAHASPLQDYEDKLAERLGPQDIIPDEDETTPDPEPAIAPVLSAADRQRPGPTHPWRTKGADLQNRQARTPVPTDGPKQPPPDSRPLKVDPRFTREDNALGPATPEQLFRLAHLIMTASPDLRHRMGVRATPETVRIMTSIMQQAKEFNPDVKNQLTVNTGPLLKRLRTFLEDPDAYLGSSFIDLEKEALRLLLPLTHNIALREEFLAHARR